MIILTITYLIFSFLLGIVIGSFLNVCIYRIPLDISVASGRSFCPCCGKQLRSLDLFPVLSYLFLQGKCRFCGSKISAQYPLIELLTGFLFVAAYTLYGFTLLALTAALFFSVLIVIAVIDYRTGLIYDRLVIFVAVLAPFYIFLHSPASLTEHILGAFIVSVPMFLMAYLLDGFGGGDIKLTAAAGLLLGWKLILISAFIAIITCGFFGITLLVRKKATGKTEIPFGPFLSIGMILALAVGEPLLLWYASLVVW